MTALHLGQPSYGAGCMHLAAVPETSGVIMHLQDTSTNHGETTTSVSGQYREMTLLTWPAEGGATTGWSRTRPKVWPAERNEVQLWLKRMGSADPPGRLGDVHPVPW